MCIGRGVFIGITSRTVTMGSAASTDQSAGGKNAVKRNKEINTQLRIDSRRDARLVKLLLLGAGESGKSTFAKQMKIIHEKGFTDKERLGYKQLIHSNTMHGMIVILDTMDQQDIPFNNSESKADKRMVQVYCQSIDRGTMELSPELGRAIKRLWTDMAVKEGFRRAAYDFQLQDSTEYYLDAIHRLSSPGYVPTEQDVLRSRLQTTGVLETRFNFNGYNFSMFDVGGQRSERRKWMHCFDNVTAIIFTAAMSAYDQVLREDAATNRMRESMELFASICNYGVFLKTSIILFLNKRDIFEVKIKDRPLTICFPDYKGANDYEDASRYIRSAFESLNTNPEKELYTHFTNATDTKNINFVFDAAMAVVLKQNLREAGMY